MKTEQSIKLTYGDGLLQTQQGTTSDGLRCLLITKHAEQRPINSTPSDWRKIVDESEIDCLLVFKNIEGARTLQDELNELISTWSKEQSLIVPPSETFDLKPKGKSVDEFCNQPPGSFKKFVKAQTDFEKREEIRRKERIRKAKAGMQNPPPAE